MMAIEQAVILAGGRGERLKPLTDRLPKPMVAVAGRPFLEYLVELLRDNGIRHFVFLLGYRGEQIQDHFEDGRSRKVAIEYSFEPQPLGTGGALRLAREKLAERFFLLFGDSYLPIDYGRMAHRFVESGKDLCLAVYDNFEDTDVPFNVMLDEAQGIVTAYRKAKDNPPSYRYCDAGVIAACRSVVDLIAGGDPVSFEEAVYPRLIAEGQAGYYRAEQRFYDIGTMARLKIFERYLTGRVDR